MTLVTEQVIVVRMVNGDTHTLRVQAAGGTDWLSQWRRNVLKHYSWLEDASGRQIAVSAIASLSRG